jgi:hypothetical protein
MVLRYPEKCLIILGLLAVLFSYNPAYAATGTLTVESCSVITGSVTISDCAGLAASDDAADVAMAKSSTLGATMSDTGFVDTINSVTVTIRHSGEAPITNNLGIVLYDTANSVNYCSEDTTTANTTTYTTDTVTACTPTGGWNTEKLDSLQLRVTNNHSGTPADAYLSYLVVTFDYTSCEGVCNGNGCDNVCDSVCGGSQCYNIDPDCDITGAAALLCCGNKNCEGVVGESCRNCSTDCGVCPDYIIGGTIEICGNGVCDLGENSCSCTADCGSCEGDVEDVLCKERVCMFGFCQKVTKPGCCGNLLCENGEDFATCGLDCQTPKGFTLTPLWEPYYLRGERVNLVAGILADSVKAAGASVAAKGFFGVLPLYDSGLWGDERKNDGIFANYFRIAPDVNEGPQPVVFDINLLDTSSLITADLNIFPYLDLSFETGKPRYLIGQIIDLNGIVARRGKPVPSEIDVNIMADGNLLFYSRRRSGEDGFFSSAYHTTTLDIPGTWVVSVRAEDKYGNYYVEEKEVELLGAKMSDFLWIALKPPLVGSFSRGSDLKVVAEVDDAVMEKVSGAFLELVAPNGDRRRLNEIGPGLYSGSYAVPWNLPLGRQAFEVAATETSGGITRTGTFSFSVPVEEAEFITEIIEPKRTTLMVGDEVEFRIRMSYKSGEPVTEPVVETTINGRTVEMQPLGEGLYIFTHYIADRAAKRVEFSITAKDEYSNYSQNSVELGVSGVSANYYIKTYPVAFYLMVFAVFLSGALFILSRVELASATYLGKKEAELIAQKKELETRYFKQGTIDRSTFNRMKSEISPELESVRKRIKAMEQKISKRKKAFRGEKV